VFYQGKNIRSLNRDEQLSFRRNIQAIFQDPFSVYNPFYPVDHVLNVPIEKFKLAKSGAGARKLMEQALEDVGLLPEETLGRYPHQLSGGQRQRIMVARALLMKPQLIIADEPVSMVDASLRATILESLRKLNKEHGISILYITHDLTTAYHVSEHIMVLYRGTIAEAGTVELVIKDPQHPYTQLLVDSIPWPDLDHTWGQQQISMGSRVLNGANHGCRFAERCSHVMQLCTEAPPPFYRLQPQRAATCYLHSDAPVLLPEEMPQLFIKR
jgi:oligopeptide/dipeptide ABC transporter ATP-binding protein